MQSKGTRGRVEDCGVRVTTRVIFLKGCEADEIECVKVMTGAPDKKDITGVYMGQELRLVQDAVLQTFRPKAGLVIFKPKAGFNGGNPAHIGIGKGSTANNALSEEALAASVASSYRMLWAYDAVARHMVGVVKLVPHDGLDLLLWKQNTYGQCNYNTHPARYQMPAFIVHGLRGV